MYGFKFSKMTEKQFILILLNLKSNIQLFDYFSIKFVIDLQEFRTI